MSRNSLAVAPRPPLPLRCKLGSGRAFPGPSSEPSWSARRGQGRRQVGLARSRAALGIAERSRKPVQPAEQSAGGSASRAEGSAERAGGRGPPPEPPSAERVGSNAVWRWRGLRARPASERKGRNLVAPRRRNEALSPTAAPWEPRSSPGSDSSPVRKAGRQRGRPPPPPHAGEQMFPLSHRHHFGLPRTEPLPAGSHHAQSLLDSSKTATPPSGSSERDFELRVASV